jgi:hypothetical protein
VIGTVGPLGEPAATPLVHTPLNLVGTVPYGQLLSAEAGEAKASGPTPMAKAHAPIRIRRFNVTISRVAVGYRCLYNTRIRRRAVSGNR